MVGSGRWRPGFVDYRYSCGAGGQLGSQRFGCGKAQGYLDNGFLRFISFFIWESLRGGFDVARRTLAPR